MRSLRKGCQGIVFTFYRVTGKDLLWYGKLTDYLKKKGERLLGSEAAHYINNY